MPEPQQEFNLRAWRKARKLSKQELTDYLNALGFNLSPRTIDRYHAQAPAWLAPLLRQRDALGALYAQFDVLHEAVIASGTGMMKPDATLLEASLNLAGDACDELEKLFALHLTKRERGESDGQS